MATFFQKHHNFTRSGVRTHAGIRPLELKSNALTTRPSWLYFVIVKRSGHIAGSELQLVEK